MASANTMPRRGALKAILSAPILAASAAPAAALCVVDPSETPVGALFREWLAADAVEADLCAGRTDLDSPEILEASNRTMHIMDKIYVTPAVSMADMVIKLCVMSNFGEGEYFGEYSDVVWAEARALIGVRG